MPDWHHKRGWFSKVPSSSESKALARRHFNVAIASHKDLFSQNSKSGTHSPIPRGSGMLGRWSPIASQGQSQQPHWDQIQNLCLCSPSLEPMLRIKERQDLLVIMKWNDQPSNPVRLRLGGWKSKLLIQSQEFDLAASVSREDPASCSFSCPNRIHKSFKDLEPKPAAISHGDRALGRQLARPTSSVLTPEAGQKWLS